MFTCKLEVMNVFEDDFEESVKFTVSVAAGVYNDNISIYNTVTVTVISCTHIKLVDTVGTSKAPSENSSPSHDCVITGSSQEAGIVL